MAKSNQYTSCFIFQEIEMSALKTVIPFYVLLYSKQSKHYLFPEWSMEKHV